MHRKLFKNLLEWKKSSTRKPLILQGARQVGKTWLLQNFGKEEYSQTAYINCDNNPALINLFEDYDISRILRVLSAISSTTIKPNTTLIILDEIQEIPKGIGVLKYFCENAPEYHIAVAGSLLGINLHEGESYPVGKVDELTLYPMSFMEFIEACGKSEIVEMLQEGDYKSLNSISNLLVDLLRQYYFTGGMPAVVDEYIKSGDLKKTRRIQNSILDNYINDISKHAPGNQIPRINIVWNSIPSQLSKENKKFIYGAIRNGARASEFEVAIQWLCDAGLIFKVNRVKTVSEPPKYYEELSAFKLYMNDCGLYGAMSQTPPEKILTGMEVFTEYKGAFTEEYVATQLRNIEDLNIFYYSKENSTMELDFLIYKNGKLIPTEVKASENLKAKSLKSILAEKENLRGIRISLSPYREEERFSCIPLWGISEGMFNTDSNTHTHI